jgi:hypothetical protein
MSEDREPHGVPHRPPPVEERRAQRLHGLVDLHLGRCGYSTDIIRVMEDSHIVEDGARNELQAEDGAHARLYNL